MPLALRLAQGTAAAGLFAVTAFPVWTKHSIIASLPQDDPLWRSDFYKQYNPLDNPTMNDVCIRRIPLYQLRPELLEDAQKGGSRLVEAFSQGVWGRWNYTVQRLIHYRGRPPQAEADAFKFNAPTTSPEKTLSSTAQPSTPSSTSITSRLSSLFSSPSASSSETTPTKPSQVPIIDTPELWSKDSLLSSRYPAGTRVTNHFLVLTRTPISHVTTAASPPSTAKSSTSPTSSSNPPPKYPSKTQSILFRCGDSPLSSPTSPRASDGLFEMSATPNFDTGYCEFQLKSIFYTGDEKKDAPPMSPTMEWMHRQYTKMWMEASMGWVKWKRFRSWDAQRGLAEERKRAWAEEDRKALGE